MARTDWESAWRDLQAWIAQQKSGYGRQELLEKMATLAKEAEVPEDLMERVVRVYGPHPLIRTQINAPEEATTGEAAEPLSDKSVGPGPPTTNGGHDGDTREEVPEPSAA